MVLEIFLLGLLVFILGPVIYLRLPPSILYHPTEHLTSSKLILG